MVSKELSLRKKIGLQLQQSRTTSYQSSWNQATKPSHVSTPRFPAQSSRPPSTAVRPYLRSLSLHSTRTSSEGRGYAQRPLRVRPSECLDRRAFRHGQGGEELGSPGARGAARGPARRRSVRPPSHRHRRDCPVVARQQRAHRGGAPRRGRDPG
jgi:hypothetical protein